MECKPTNKTNVHSKVMNEHARNANRIDKTNAHIKVMHEHARNANRIDKTNAHIKVMNEHARNANRIDKTNAQVQGKGCMNMPRMRLMITILMLMCKVKT